MGLTIYNSAIISSMAVANTGSFSATIGGRQRRASNKYRRSRMPVFTLLVAGQPRKAENLKRPEDSLPELAVKLDEAPAVEVGTPARADLGKQSVNCWRLPRLELILLRT